MRGPLALGLVCAIALGACGGHSSGGALTSGIQGVVQAGPTCPVEEANSPCPDEPVPSTVRAVSVSDAGIIGQTKTDPSGRFRLPLEPGTYIVTATPAHGTLTPFPVTVEVKSGAFAAVRLEADTGIR
jgi:hypothetical protein